MPELSFVIRTLNEEKWLGEVLHSINQQTFKDYEIVLVDSGSHDRTLEIAREYNCRIVEITKDTFNYSYASNIGAKEAKGGLLAYVSGHSVPAHPQAIEVAVQHFKDPKVAGVYGDVLALPDGSIWEKTFHYLGRLKDRNKGAEVVTAIKPGLLSCTNAIIRKDLWQLSPFDERFGRGGEDLAWAVNWLQKGYQIIREPDFLIYHSHGSSLRRFKQEIRNWNEMYGDVCKVMEIET